MPDDEGFMKPDEFQQTYGIDPGPLIEQEKLGIKPPNGERGFLARYGGNLAVGAATAYPSWIALPETIYAGGKAAYSALTSDAKFMEEFDKNLQIEGAQKNLIDHLNRKAAQIAQENPGLGEEEIYRKIDEYRNSKAFEDFSLTQIKGGVGKFAEIQDAARGLVGDERTEAQRDWTDTASEILGGALVGGPAGIPAKIANAAAKRAATHALLNNPISRAAIKGVELTTPVTVPYTPGNVIANAAVGTAIDQAARFARGQDTAFNPKDETSAGVGTLVGSAYAIAGTLAFVAAMKGGQKAAIAASTQNEVAKALKASPSVDDRIAARPKTGQALITSGEEQQLNPPSAIDEGGVISSTLTRARGQLFDQGSPLVKQIQVHRPGTRLEADATFHSTTGPVLEDTVNQATEQAMHEIHAAIGSASPENARAIEAGMLLSTAKARYDRIEDALVQKISKMRDKKSDAYKTAVEDLARIRNDKDETARPLLPELPRSHINDIAVAYEKGTTHDVVRARDAHVKWANLMIDNEVRSGRMSADYAAHLRRVDKYYTPLMSDPLGGATGVERVRRVAVRSIKKAQTQGLEGTTSAISRESPIRELKLTVPKKTENRNVETRITHPKDARASMTEYTRNSFRSLAQQDTRNRFIKWLETNPDGSKSDFIKNRYMAVEPNPHTGKHWTPAEKVYNNDKIMKMLDDVRFVPEWQNGQLRLWKFGDPELSLALRMDPVKVAGLMQLGHKSSNWFKYFTTGAGNPIFSVKGALYNIFINMLTRRGDRAYGTLSYAIHRYLPKPVANIVRALTFDIDPTILVTAPYHTLASITEFMAWAGARQIADRLKAIGPFNAFRQAVGEQAFQKMLQRATSIASWTENLATLKMMRGGATHGIRSVDDVATVRGGYQMLTEKMPQGMKAAYSFYKGLLDSVYLGGSRPYYVQNHALLAHKYGGASKIPQGELTQLMHETRTVGGDMSLIPASKHVRDIEAWFPYMSQAKLGAYHLARHAFGKETWMYVQPRLFAFTMAVGASFYWRTYWNEESRKEFWQRRPEYDRYRIIDIPTPQLLWAWANGENPAYNRKLYYSITLPPDLVGIVAGSAAMMQEMGMLPKDATPKPILGDLPQLWMNSMTPAMPPLVQALFALGGAKLDPQGADTRGGNIIRMYGNQFRAGPQAESLSNLGQVSNSTSLIMNAMFGAMGSYLAGSTDVLLHAAKFKNSAETGGKLTARDQFDFAAGLRAATGSMVERMTTGAPDVPVLWQNQERYRTTTPAWQYVTEGNTHIRSVVGMRNDAMGKAAERKRQMARSVGGIPEQAVQDQVLVTVANELNAFQSPTGMLGRFKKQYNDLSNNNRALVSQYNLPQNERQAAVNANVKKMQDNMQQQHLAHKYFEQQIAARYGPVLVTRLRGRPFTIANLDAMMRESFGITPPPQDAAEAAQ